jgi:hypothetical protein
MRDYLIGYLLDALEPAEQELVESQLESDSQLRHELDLISRSLDVLAVDKAHYEPPAGFAHRTRLFVAQQTKAVPASPVAAPPAPASRWSMADLAMAAGIFLAATALFWPAMNQSRFAARVMGCQNNLGKLGVALQNYATIFPGQLPTPSVAGNLDRAGAYAVILKESGVLGEPEVLICPASALADQAVELRVPTCRELKEAQAEQLTALRSRLKGIYGYNLGFVIKGRYYPPKHLRSATYALMADSPCPNAPLRRSDNHEGHGQNVLFGDMHVQYLTSCKAKGCTDHIFVNDAGKPSAGLHERDAVIGASDDCPLEALKVEVK